MIAQIINLIKNLFLTRTNDNKRAKIIKKCNNAGVAADEALKKMFRK